MLRLRLLAEGLLLAAVVGVVGLRHHLSARDIAEPASRLEEALAASRAGTAPAGFPGSFSETVLDWHVTAYAAISGAGSRHDSGVGVVRELVVVAAAVGALALYLLCRRIGFAVLGSTVAVSLVGVIPAAAALRITAFPGTVAAMWLLLGAVLLTVFAQRRQTVLATVAATSAAVAVEIGWATAPVGIVLAAGVLVALLVTDSIGAGWPPRWRALTLTASVVGALAVLWLTIAGPFAQGVGTVGSTTVAGFTAVGLLAVALACWLTLWLRPLAVTAAPLLLAAWWPGPAQGTALVLLLPVMGVLVLGLVEHALSEPSRLPRRAVVAFTAGLAAVAVATLMVLPAPAPQGVSSAAAETRTSVAAGGPASPAATRAPAGSGSAPATDDGASPERLAEWLLTQLHPTTVVLVDPQLREDLVAAGVPEDRLVPFDESDSDPPAQLIVGPLAAAAELPLVAQFGADDGALAVRLLVDDPEATAAELDEEVAARMTFGAALADNPNLTLSRSAASALAAGEVDARLLTVLAGAAARYQLRVIDFPASSGDLSQDPQRREALIIEVRTAAGDGGVDDLQDYLGSQLPPYQPLSAEVDSTILTVRYPAPAPIGLLP